MPVLNWLTTSKFGGLNTLRTADEIQRGEGALTLNSDHSTSSSLGPLDGYTLFGNQANPNDNIIRKFTYYRGENTQIQLQVRDDGTNYIVEYLNTKDTRNLVGGEWLILESGLSRIQTLLDGSTIKNPFSFASENDTSLSAVTNTDTSYAFVNSNPDTITDSNNSFISDGFKSGNVIQITGSANNNGRFTIATVVAGTITLISDDSLTVESAGANITIDASGSLNVTRRLIYGNGVEDLRIWSGATTAISITTSNTIKKIGTLSWAEAGFDATGSVIINGTEYAYTGGSVTTTLTGVTPDPTGEANTSGVAQIVDISTYKSNDKAGILHSANRRLWLLHNTMLSFSEQGDATNLTSGSNPADPGFDDFPQLKGPGTGLSDLNEWTIVFSETKVLATKFTFPTSTTRVTIMKEISDEGAVNPKAITKIGDRVFYITPRGGIKEISQIEAEDTFNVTDLTTKIRPTIKNFIWDDASLTYFPRDQILVASGRSSSDISINDKAVIIQFSEGETGIEQINLGIIDWFIGDATIYNEQFHWGSSVESRSFRSFEGDFSKNGAPYDWVRTEKIETYPEAGGQFNRKKIKYLGVTGLIATGTTLNIKLAYDINGSLATQGMSLVGTDTDFVVFQALNTLGAFSLNTEPLGGTRAGVEDMNPFFIVFALPNEYLPYSTQLTFKTSGVGQNVQINSYAFAYEDAKNHPDRLKGGG